MRKLLIFLVLWCAVVGCSADRGARVAISVNPYDLDNTEIRIYYDLEKD